MKYLHTLFLALPLAAGFSAVRDAARNAASPEPAAREAPALELGAFSVSLAVEDLAASRAFYETLGFRQIAGNQEQNWIILQNGTSTIGLFHGMFERNIMTFNPGWDQHAEPLDAFLDVRDIQRRLKDAGLELQLEAEADGRGPASFLLVDPDGNSILVDQHVDRPTPSGE